MKKVFLAAPFKSLVNSKTMSMDEEKKNEIVNLIEFLEKKDIQSIMLISVRHGDRNLCPLSSVQRLIMTR